MSAQGYQIFFFYQTVQQCDLQMFMDVCAMKTLTWWFLLIKLFSMAAVNLVTQNPIALVVIQKFELGFRGSNF